MLNRTSTTRILFGSGVLVVVGLFFLLAFIRMFGRPVGDVEYHPPATQNREATKSALQEWDGRGGQGNAIFVPESQPGQPLAIGARLSHSTVPVGQPTTVHAAIAVRADEAGAVERSALNLSLVIDRSGSMHGLKAHNAKNAAHFLINSLTARDRIAIVAYGSEVETLSEPIAATSENRLRLHQLVSDIDPFGGTNLSGGFERGLELVRTSQQPDDISRVVLLSDGRANEGLTDLDALGGLATHGLETGVSLSTMGVGLDYDEDVLQRMATAGAGNYYFIDDDRDTREVFARELDSLKSSVARSTELRLSLGPWVRFVGAEGFDARREGNVVTIDLAAFTGGQQKDLLVELEIDPKATGSLDLLDTELSYVAVDAQRPQSSRLTSTLDVAAGRVAVDPAIMRRVQQIATANAFDEAMRLYDRGDRHAAAALVDHQRRSNVDFLARHDVDDPDFDRVNDELESLAEALRKTERHTSKGKWLVKSGKFRAQEITSSSVEF